MDRITIFTHGTSKGNPGPATIGVRMEDSKGKVIKEVSESIGNATDDYAEYFAVVRGLQTAVDLFGDKTKKMEFALSLKSELVKGHLNAEQQINDVRLIGHFIEVYNLRVASFPNFFIT